MNKTDKTENFGRPPQVIQTRKGLAELRQDMNKTDKAVRADLICRNVPRNAQEQALMDASPSADCSLNAPAVTDSRTVASYPTITLTLPNPISGFWDGGAKSRFTFKAIECNDGIGKFLKWGSWEMNFWRTTDGIGRSPKDAASRMVLWMKRNIRHEGATITVNP